MRHRPETHSGICLRRFFWSPTLRRSPIDSGEMDRYDTSRLCETDPHRLVEAMDAALAGYLDAKAAMEMAAVDLLARGLGIPVHQYLGGGSREIRFRRLA